MKGTFSSWTIENEDIAIKQCDKSVFEHYGSAVPREIYWFFRADSLKVRHTCTWPGSDSLV